MVKDFKVQRVRKWNKTYVIIVLLQCNCLSFNGLDRKFPVLQVQVRDNNQHKYLRVQDKIKALERWSGGQLPSTTVVRHSEGPCADTQCEPVQWPAQRLLLSHSPGIRTERLFFSSTDPRQSLPATCHSASQLLGRIWSQTLHSLPFNLSQEPGMWHKHQCWFKKCRRGRRVSAEPD